MSSEDADRARLEYGEPDEAADIVAQATEADVPLPVLPAPRSSDGNVRSITFYVPISPRSFHLFHSDPFCWSISFTLNGDYMLTPCTALGYSYAKFRARRLKTLPPGHLPRPRAR